MRTLHRSHRPLALLALPFLLPGCATLQSWFRSAGTYAVAAPTPAALGGRGEVRGTLFLTTALGNVMMEGRDPPPVAALLTEVKVEPSGWSVQTDQEGRFALSDLEPGDYRLAFSDPEGREIWVEFQVQPDQHLDVAVWVQWGGADQRHMSEGTTPQGMFPGHQAFDGISSGSSGPSSERSEGRSSGGGGGR